MYLITLNNTEFARCKFLAAAVVTANNLLEQYPDETVDLYGITETILHDPDGGESVTRTKTSWNGFYIRNLCGKTWALFYNHQSLVDPPTYQYNLDVDIQALITSYRHIIHREALTAFEDIKNVQRKYMKLNTSISDGNITLQNDSEFLNTQFDEGAA
jgi:hypothetical protein